MRFGLIGDGRQAQYHRKAIEHVGGEIVWVYDPLKQDCAYLCEWVDYAVICSPSDQHRWQIQDALRGGDDVIAEKPCCLPWEPLVDDDRVNVVLQYRYAPLPEKADRVEVVMVRDQAYFDTWKGDPRKTGGVFFNLFIHYIDLAVRLGADFHGAVVPEGKQVRMVDDMDLFQFDTQGLYNAMYEDILAGKGVKPRDLFYLHWLMEKHSLVNGFGKGCVGKRVFIPKELL